MAGIAIQSVPQPTVSPSNGSPKDDKNHRLSPQSHDASTSGTPVARQIRSPARKPKEPEKLDEPQPTEWGRNFWVTLVDPQTQAQFYACPSTGETTWDAPVGNFVLPPSSEGEWWELRDETRGGIPYYYHTKSGDTTWEKPDGFVIPLGIVQNTTLGRKLSQSTRRYSQLFPSSNSQPSTPTKPHSSSAQLTPSSTSRPSRRAAARASPPSVISERTEEASGSNGDRSDQRERANDDYHKSGSSHSSHTSHNERRTSTSASRARSKSSSHLSSSSPSGPQSLTAAVELINGAGAVNGGVVRETLSAPDGQRRGESPRRASGHAREGGSSDPLRHKEPRSSSHSPERRRISITALRPGRGAGGSVPSTPITKANSSINPIRDPTAFNMITSTHQNVPGAGQPNEVQATPNVLLKSPRRPVPAVPASSETGGFWRPRRNTAAGTAMNIGKPVLDIEATRFMSPLKKDVSSGGRPIYVTTKRLSTGEHPLLPRDLVSDIQQFSQSEFAKRYFSTHREGLIFRRKVPMERMMTWQKTPITSPLLVMNKSLHRDAVRIFKVVQRIMGDRDRDRPAGVRHTESNSSLHLAASSSTSALLEQERWLLGEGVMHGEMRDEIYCQVIKQLRGNMNRESTFRGWQLLCVLLVTFPPSKNFEPYVRSFMQQNTTMTEGRVDIMAQYCLHRLTAIAKKGPRGKPPTIAEIENASDAAFNPSTFGESLDAIYRLQERTYADLKVPVILPFLADGILALGGTKQEGIFRVPGDADAVSELRLRIDKGVYNLEGIDDPHVPASLFKLWLRELLDPLIPQELYNECIGCADEPELVVAMVGRLPTIHRRVVLFVVSFLQLFLEERVQQATKMTSANLALVMAPNLLRCNSDSISVVFTNAQYEHRFVLNLLLHLRCGQVDAEYVPEHGKGAVPPLPTSGRKSHQKSRRPKA